MPKPKPSSKSWLDVACDSAVRFGHRMRDEWKEGKAEVLQDETKPREETDAQKKATGVEWWDVLQVSQSATAEDIRLAYRRLIKENHPDKSAHLSPEMQAAVEHEAKRLNEAYERAMKGK